MWDEEEERLTENGGDSGMPYWHHLVTGILVAMLALSAVILISEGAAAAADLLGAAIPDPEEIDHPLSTGTFMLFVSISEGSLLTVSALLLLFFYRGPLVLRISANHLVYCSTGILAVWLINMTGTWLIKYFGEPYRGAPEKTGGYLAVAVFMIAVVLAPVMEELFFREILLSRIMSRTPWIAGIISSISFGVLHVASGGFILVCTLTAMGAVLAWVRIRTGSLGPPVLVHASNNVLFFLLG